MATASSKVISADSHFVEPPEMWTERIDPAFRDRAPRVVDELDGRKGQFIVCDGVRPSPVGSAFGAGVPADELPELLEKGFAAAPAYVRDPSARLLAQDQDGVAAEVLYATYGMQLYALDDGAFRAALFRAFNDWAAEYCGAHPKRLFGIGLLALDDTEDAVLELKRIAEKGLKGAMIWAEPPEDKPYSHSDYAPFWSAAQDLQMKLSLHSLTSRRGDKGALRTDIVYAGVLLYQEVARTLADLILHGVLERYPDLKIVSAENEIAWLPFHLWRMDMLYEKLHAVSPVKLEMKPSDYFNRQVYATFIEDSLFTATLDHVGADNIMWSNDFPHIASTWPKSHEFIETRLGQVPQPELRKLVHDTVARLYDIDVAAL